MMSSVPGAVAVATGFDPRDGRNLQDTNPVATAPDTDLITKFKHLPKPSLGADSDSARVSEAPRVNRAS